MAPTQPLHGHGMQCLEVLLLANLPFYDSMCAMHPCTSLIYIAA